jgi:hypothetical protein
MIGYVYLNTVDRDGERFIGVENTKFTFSCGIKSRYHKLSLKAKLVLFGKYHALIVTKKRS